jgi:hypothetical protein
VTRIHGFDAKELFKDWRTFRRGTIRQFITVIRPTNLVGIVNSIAEIVRKASANWEGCLSTQLETLPERSLLIQSAGDRVIVSGTSINCVHHEQASLFVRVPGGSDFE